MSNEELVALIQAGDRDRIMELWNQVKRMVYKKAGRWATYRSGGTTEADLRQAGFIAVMRAADSYDPSKKVKFSTYLGNYLLAEFSAATGWTTRASRLAPLQNAVSLDAPLEAGEDTTLAYFMPDPAAEAAILDIEDQDWRRHLSADLEFFLSMLSEKEQRTIRARYYQGQTQSEIAAAEGVSRGTVFMREKSALRKLRRPACSKILRQYL